MSHRARTLLDRSGSLALSYSPVGGTGGPPPAGYRYFRRRARVSADVGDFDSAVDALRTWQVQRGAGLAVTAEGRARVGVHVVIGFGPAPFTLLAPCRVVEDIEDETRSGFAYGTLTGHPESGEERFVVERRPGEGVFFEITAFSRPAALLVRLGGPVARIVQDRVTEGYLRAMRRAVTGP